jgi:hypothetical protein
LKYYNDICVRLELLIIKNFKKIKKMFFTAIAMIAFSGVAMAKSNVNKGIKVKVVVATKLCDDVARAVVQAHYQYVWQTTGGIVPIEVANAIRANAKSACEKALTDAPAPAGN